MKRIIISGLIAVGGLFGVAHAQSGPVWHHPPSIVVVSVAGDPRLQMVDDAVAFWNRTLKKIGSGFRFGPVTHIVQPMPEKTLQALGDSFADGDGYQNIPETLRALPGDIAIVLAQSEFPSFTTFGYSKRIIAIRGMNSPPLSLPNVALNVIAHELGHALGLGHNSDPSMLMCGRPAWCRPYLFCSNTPHVFPLTEREKRELIEMYPSVRKPETPSYEQTG